MNVARLFAYTKAVEAERDRALTAQSLAQSKLEDERQRFIDTLRRDAGKPSIYSVPEPPKQKPLPPAIGLQQSLARDAEIERRKEEASTGKPGIVIPPAIGPTGALARDKAIATARQNQIADDESIRMAALSVTSNGGGA